MIASHLWQIAGWTMLHYLWVGAMLGAVVLLVRQRLRSAAANTRYLFALGGLLLLSVAPAAIAVVVMQDISPAPHNVSLPADSARQPAAMSLEQVRPMVATAGMPVPAEAANLPAQADSPHGSEQLLAAMNLAAMCLPWLWVCGAPLSFALTTAGLLGAERLRRQSRPLEDARITEMCRQLAASLRISYRVSVAICDRIAAPILVGVLRPMILLPAAALAGWDPQQLEMVLLHELAHVRRYDNLVNLLQRIVESVLFFQPMVWIISAWVRREREHCCDELVVARTHQPHAYAEILVTLAETLSVHPVEWGKRSAAPPAYSQIVSSMAERPLVARIRRILKKEEQSMQVSRKAVGLVFVGLLAITAMIGGYYSLPSQADDSAGAEKYRLQHVFKDGQIIRGEVRRESLIYVPNQMCTQSTATTSQIGVRTINDRPKETQTLALSWRNVHVHSVWPKHDGITETTDFDAVGDQSKSPDSGYCRLLGRTFTLEIDPARKATLVSGLDQYLASLKGPLAHNKQDWAEAIRQMVDQPNAYFPLHPVAVGDTWTIRRKLRIIPMGYPLLHSFGTVEPWEENVSAKLAAIKGSGKDRLAIIELSGAVASSGRAFRLTGEIRILVQQQTLTRQIVTLVDPEAAAAKKDPTSKILTRLDIISAADSAGGLSLSSDQPAAPKPNAPSGMASTEEHKGQITFAGLCHDDHGQPVADAELSLFLRDDEALSDARLQSIRTDRAGRFRFKSVATFREGHTRTSYWLSATARGRATVVLYQSALRSQDADQLQIAMSEAASVRGKITGPDGQPVEGAKVWTISTLRPIEGINTVTSNAEGLFEIADLKKCDGKPVPVLGHPGAFSQTGSLLVIQHPRFAKAMVAFSQAPSTVNVTLQPPAVIEGRVVYGDTKTPAAGVRLFAQPTKENELLHSLGQATTDALGRYRFDSLTAGKYNVLLFTHKDDYTMEALDSFEATSGTKKTAPDLRLVHGAVIVGRVIDADTGQSICPTVTDSSWHQPDIMLYGPSRPRSGAACESAAIREDGSFQLRAAPGDNQVHLRHSMGRPASGVNSFTMESQWEVVSPDTFDLSVNEGRTVTIEFKVRQKTADSKPQKSPAATQPTTDAVPAAVAKPMAGIPSSDNEGEEQALQNFKNRYALAEGEVCKYVTPSFLPGRLIYYRQSSPGQAESMPRGPDAMCFCWQDGKLVNWSMTFGEQDLLGILKSLADFYPQEVEGDETLVRAKIQGDWIVRKGAPQAEIVSAIERILDKQCGLHVKLRLRDVERKVTVASGAFEFHPIPGRSRPNAIDVFLYDDALETHGGGSGDIETFVRSLGWFVHRRIISDVRTAPKDGLTWYYCGSMRSLTQKEKEVTDAYVGSVLKHVTEQTGLTFKEETRSVPVLVVERVK